MNGTFSLAVHGGCGNVVRGRFSEEEERAYRNALEESLRAGEELLERGKSSIDAVEVAVKVMEDSPLFNAGRGSVFTHRGEHEMDAAIMDGRTQEAGAVAGVKRLRNPISVARSIMEQSTHVMLAGEGAEAFAREQQLEFATDEWLYDQKRWEQYQKALQEGSQFMDHSSDEDKYGTVGAVALDQQGNLAAATSTGGITNKKQGRIGDSPLIGAGTYAKDATCAVSCTGEGEFFIRHVTAHTLSAWMEQGKLELDEASRKTMHSLKELGGHGGLIAVDPSGQIVTPFNTEGMFRGWTKEGEEVRVEMYGE